ncbi:hypothetical protein QUF90_05175 [Desulfococcaceae bacterium HSG9]|nr:hypothetical protein [Desulfococcaceae bacterium HSG9]
MTEIIHYSLKKSKIINYNSKFKNTVTSGPAVRHIFFRQNFFSMITPGGCDFPHQNKILWVYINLMLDS